MKYLTMITSPLILVLVFLVFFSTGHAIAVESYPPIVPDGEMLENYPHKIVKDISGSAPVHSVAFNPTGGVFAAGYSDAMVRLWDVSTGREILRLEGHTGSVYSVHFNPDGKILASGSSDNTVRLWDVMTGKQLLCLKGHAGSIHSVEFNPDGRILASGSSDRTIRLWDVASGKEIRLLEGHVGEIHSVHFSPDGKMLGSGAEDHFVVLWYVDSGMEALRLDHQVGSIGSICFSPDGKTMASGSTDKYVRLWDITSGKEIKKFDGHFRSVNSVYFSPDGKVLATGASDNSVRLWDIASGKEIRFLKGHTNRVNSVRISPDGKTLISGASDKTVCLWDIAVGQNIKRLKGHRGSVRSICFSPNSQKLASGSDDFTMRLWDVAEGREIRVFRGHGGSVHTVQFSRDGKTLASASDDKMVRLWDASSGEEIGSLEGHTDRINSIDFTPDDKVLASGSFDNTVLLWDVDSEREIGRLEGHASWVQSVRFRPDGKMLASGSDDKSIILWNVAAKKEIRRLNGHTASVNSVDFDPDGKVLASGSSDNTVRLWDVASGKNMGLFEGHTRSIFSIQFSPDGKTLASGSYDGSLRLWDVASGQEIRRLEDDIHWIESVRFSPDGKTIAAGFKNSTVRLWDVSTGQEIRRLEGHSHPVHSVRFSPSGNTLASASDDNLVRLWDFASKKEIKRLEGHTGPVRFVNFLKDGSLLATGSDDKTIRLWDVASGQEIRCFEDYPVLNNSMQLSPDGGILAIGSDDHIIRLWDMDTGKKRGPLTDHNGSINTLQFSRDQQKLASGANDGVICLWDIATGVKKQRFKGHDGPVHSICFSNDGALLASGSGDKTVRLWDVGAGKAVQRFEGFTDSVHSVCFSPDGKIVAAGSNDNSVSLWNVNTGKKMRHLSGHSGSVSSIHFSSDGKILASGSYDGSIRLWDVKSGEFAGLFIGGRNRTWLSWDAETKLCRRFDDGTFLTHNKDGKITPVPPRIGTPGKGLSRQDITTPKFIETRDGEPTIFYINITNNHSARFYWIDLAQIVDEASPLQFHPPETGVILDPGKAIRMKCGVSAQTSHDDPVGGDSILRLKATTAYGEPVLFEIPVRILSPSLELVRSELQEGENQILLATVKNTGAQDLDSKTEFFGKVAGYDLIPIRPPEIRAGESVPLPFVLPEKYKVGQDSFLSLSAVKLEAPVHRWNFPNESILLPSSSWPLYLSIVCLIVFLGAAVFYMSIYRHPLTLQLSKNHSSMFRLPIEDFPRAVKLLKKTRRLETILSVNKIEISRLNAAISFVSKKKDMSRANLLIERVGQISEKFSVGPIEIFEIRMRNEFMLNFESCFMAFLPDDMPGTDGLNELKNSNKIGKSSTCLIIATTIQQQASSKEISRDMENWFVTPDSGDLTEWLLSSNPLEPFSRIISSQIDLKRISPYQIIGGVNNESVFFGRENLLNYILKRKPANYLLVGARQIGKSSLLKEVKRRCNKRDDIDCHYIVLSSDNLIGRMAFALDLTLNSKTEEIHSQIRQVSNSKRVLFLVDEADKFIESETKNGCKTLHMFRSLSEEGICHFIFAGFWKLYRIATYDYQSPIKNFGEILQIGALEPNACRKLSTIPMRHLNIRYDSDVLIKKMLFETGGRANLIAITCSEIIQKIDIRQRVILKKDLDNALYSTIMKNALKEWRELSGNDIEANKLDRFIVYAGMMMNKFNLKELLQYMKDRQYPFDPVDVEQSLARLELAFVLEKKRGEYSFRVPILRKIIEEEWSGRDVEGNVETF